MDGYIQFILSQARYSLKALGIENQEQLDNYMLSLDSRMSLGFIENYYPFDYLDSVELKVEIVECIPSVSRQRHLDIKLEDIGGATQLVLDKKYSYLVYKIVVVYIAMKLVVECDVLRFVCFRFASPTTLFAGVLGEIRYPP